MSKIQKTSVQGVALPFDQGTILAYDFERSSYLVKTSEAEILNLTREELQDAFELREEDLDFIDNILD